MSVRPPKVDTKLPEGLDKYFDKKSMEILEYFGIHTPALMNNYCCAVEDALIDLVNKHKALKQEYSSIVARYGVLIDALKETTASKEVDEVVKEIEEGNAADPQ